MPKLRINDAYSFLVFPKDWIGTILPVAPANRSDYDIIEKDFVIELHDTEDNQIYIIETWPHYESIEDMMSINTYMLNDHYCTCRRKSDAANQGAITDNKCEGNRFIIRSVRAKGCDYTLYSEVKI